MYVNPFDCVLLYYMYVHNFTQTFGPILNINKTISGYPEHRTLRLNTYEMLHGQTPDIEA